MVRIVRIFSLHQRCFLRIMSENRVMQADAVRYVEYIPGDTNLVISVPHGGDIRPVTMPDRTPGAPLASSETEDTHERVTTVADTHTLEMGVIMARQYELLTHQRPHLVMCHLHRSKLDVNRPLHTAAQGCPQAEEVYHKYHKLIRDAKQSIDGPGLIIDLHGQNHQQNTIEIGYLLTKDMLNSEDYTRRHSSIHHLISRQKLELADILHGDNSLGAMLEEAGYKCCPSPRQRCPGQDKYFKGGYITQTHGSSQAGSIDAIQLEVPSEIRHENGREFMEQFAKKCAQVLVRFMRSYYCENNNKSSI